MKNKRTPDIRFPGFFNNWERCKLDKILKERKVKQKISKELPLLAFAAGQGVIDRSERKTNNRDFLTKDSTKKTYLLTKYDDIVYNPSNLKYGAIDRNKHGQGVISPIYVTFETDEIPSFIELIVKSENFKQRALQYEEGTVTKRQSVKPESLLCLNVVLPNSKDEQIRIGNFFKQLDDTIALHQQELTTLKQTKQGFLQKMFPKEGELVPEVRFPGFTGEWEECELGAVIENMYNGQTPSRFNDENWNGEINWLSSGELNRGVVTTTIEKITPKGQKDANLRIVPKGTFVMAITGLEAAGTRGNCAMLLIDTTLNQSCMAIFPKESVLDSVFLFQWYRKVGEEYGIRYTQGTKQQSYNAELIKLLPIIVPKIDEQIKIGNFFKQLDETITLHQRELDALKETKKAFLQKMFA
ncbi:restriction endonuclease subunit S [Bacillus thuringiensis]|uniref:restriction endonuclease subunit S n=1 Tax=Bacillus thuringiensis TaxID=1428 RepID=UPI000BED3270|nr:restriction endonuclease subunit S [Bacillus thuringiensis]PEC12988.1 type I restriction endonuclease subunit S [Bacillus thuringiensis]PGV64222.1 type I restriction endonuclease subunit S [Bacillus thuringiensis]